MFHSLIVGLRSDCQALFAFAYLRTMFGEGMGYESPNQALFDDLIYQLLLEPTPPLQPPPSQPATTPKLHAAH